jgi:hypothetical protein
MPLMTKIKKYLSSPRLSAILFFGWFTLIGSAQAHGVSESDQSFLTQSTGMHLIPYLYLGAKHMVTGYDHLLFLFGVVFFLYRMKEVGLYVTLFAVGHSTTLLLGVLNGWHINPYLVDTIIGLSIVYRAFDNLEGFKKFFGVQPNKKAAVLIFGFFHGLGLATKLQDFALSSDGLIPNMLAFNAGVEIGQLLALGMILVVMRYWRSTVSFARHAVNGNFALMSAGFILAGYQFTGLLLAL